MSKPALSPAIQRIKASPTVAMTKRAGAMRSQEIDIIGLSVGEPDFPTPPHVVDAAARAMRDGQTRYTDVDGSAAMKDAIIAKFNDENGLDYTRNQISVGAGGKQVLFNALISSLSPDDEVIIPAPYWVSYPDIVRFADAEPVIVPTRSANGYRMEPQQLADAIGPATRWLILNSPSNPTGTAYSAEELEAFGEILRAHPDILILSDDIYEHIRFTREPFATIAAVCPDLKDRTVTLNGVSKAYAMTGWRLGFAGGPEWLIGAMAKLQSQSSGNPSSISQAAAIAALTGPKDFLGKWRTAFRERRDLITSLLNDTPGLSCPLPDGAFYVFPDCSKLIGAKRPDGQTIADDIALTEYLLDEAHVATVAGSAFGHPGAFRISYAIDSDSLKEAGTRIQEALSRLTLS